MPSIQTLARTHGADRPALRQPQEAATQLFWAVTLGLLILHAVLAWTARSPGVSTGQDDSIYLMLGRALRAGGYHDPYLVGTPAHNLYPPGYPAFLALLGGLVGERYALFQAFGIAAATAALGVFTAAVRQLWSDRLALVCLAALVGNPHLVGTAGKIASEPLYLLLSMLALWLLATRSPSPRLLALAGVAALAAALTRSVGVALLAALAAHWLLERRYAAVAAFAAAGAATVGAWLLWTIFAPEKLVSRSYVADVAYVAGGTEAASPAGLFAERALSNLSKYFGHFLPNRIGIPSLPGPAALDLLVAVGVGLAIMAGVLVLWKSWRPAALYLLLYGGLLTIWTWSIGRFLNVLIPLLVLAMLLGLRALAERVRPGWGGGALAAAALLLVLLGGVRSAKLIEERSACRWGTKLPSAECRGGEAGAFFSALAFVDRQLPAEAVLLTGKPAPAYYYTGRRTIPPGRASGVAPASFLDVLRDEGVEYVVLARLHPLEYHSLARRLEANCEALSLEATFQPHTLVLRVLDPGQRARDGAACSAIAAYRELPFRDVAAAEP